MFTVCEVQETPFGEFLWYSIATDLPRVVFAIRPPHGRFFCDIIKLQVELSDLPAQPYS